MATVNPELGEINTDNSLAAQELQSQIEEKFFTQAQEASTAQVFVLTRYCLLCLNSLNVDRTAASTTTKRQEG